jgi:hypothetical protein
LKSSGARGRHTIPPLRGARIPLCEYHNLPHTRRAQMNHVVLCPHTGHSEVATARHTVTFCSLSAKSCMHEQQDSTPKSSWVCLGRVSFAMHMPPFNNGHNTLSCNTRLSHACTVCPRVADCQHPIYKTMITLRQHDERAQHSQAGPHACTLSRAPSNPQHPCSCACVGVDGVWPQSEQWPRPFFRCALFCSAYESDQPTVLITTAEKSGASSLIGPKPPLTRIGPHHPLTHLTRWTRYVFLQPIKPRSSLLHSLFINNV